MQERSTESKYYEENSYAIQFKLDNELELVFAAVFQKVIKLTYVETFLIDMQNSFKDKFSTALLSSQIYAVDYKFDNEYKEVLALAENSAKQTMKMPKAMRSFNESLKSKKTVASMIESPNEIKKDENIKKVNIVESPKVNSEKTVTSEDIILENRKKLREKLAGKKSPQSENKNKIEREKGGKKPRVWDLGGSSKDAVILDRSKDHAEDVQYKNIQNDVSMHPVVYLYAMTNCYIFRL